MDCLKGYIGFSSKENAAAESGLYVDSLPEITVSLSDKLADTTQTDSAGVWKDVEKRSILKFRTLFTSQINQCHHINNRDKIECLICENKELIATSLWYLMGAEFLLEQINSTRINRFTTIDKTKAKELRAEFTDLFTKELETACNTIDIHASTCFEDEEPQCNNIIRTVIPII